MTTDPNGDDRAAERAHFGAVAAGLSHEMTNALATTQAAAGLVEDYCGLVAQGRDVDPERFAVAAQRLGRSLERGLAMVEHLHWFGHTVDDPATAVSLDVLAQRVVDSAAVLIRRRNVTVDIHMAAGDELQLTGEEFDLHHVVYLVLKHALSHAAALSTVLVQGEADGPDRVALRVTVLEPVQDGDAPHDGSVVHEALRRRSGATLSAVGPGSPGLIWILQLPRLAPATVDGRRPLDNTPTDFFGREDS